ncbi:quinone oxidoreductase [Paraburkholderia phytofirmans OLGA172]|uniref:Quinone oxidoreductase n=1 Tax=Paraburkholderia phytofirmans OLGA172 TaxID=1417228 RepID=A0A160FWA0_9BURK|nr:quinone oxidoreductase [Paraburkholderia phytofirmans]ANB77208.1 quinone oxidoreductase [Paraburkholderia phytofirmans OLGA172]
MPFAVVMHAPGDPDVLKFEEVTVPQPQSHEVVVRHTAIGVNFHDAYVRSGLYNTLSLPGVPGIEAAGVVEAIGANVTDFRPGDRVAYVSQSYGAYAEKRVIGQESLVLLPPNVSDEVAAATLLKGLTAQVLVQQVYRVQKDDWVLVHAAAGGVGLLLCQWARHLGARVIGTVSTPRKGEAASRAGCESVIFYRDEDFVPRVLDITAGEGVQVAYDSVGKDTFFGSLQCLAPCGHLANFGQASGAVEQFEVSQLFPKSNSLSRPNIMQHLRTAQKFREAAASLFDALSMGIIRTGQIQSISLRDAAQAHTELESRERTTSLVLKP